MDSARRTQEVRKVWIDLTIEGKKLSEAAKSVPYAVYDMVNLPDEDIKKLYDVLSKINDIRLTQGEENES